MPKYLDINGLRTLWAQITNKISQEQKDLITIVEKEGPIVSTESIEGLAIHPVSYIEPVQEGEGDPSLNNVRSISGWDSVNVTRTGKNLANLFDFNQTVRSVVITAKDGIVTMNGTPSSSTSVLLWKSTLKPGTYTLSHNVLSGSMIGAAEAASVLSGAGMRTRLNAPAATFTVEEETEYSFSIILAASTVTYDNFIFSAQLEQGDTATDFEPPNMQTLTAEFPETVYGGYANLATGVCVKTCGFVELTGNENMTLNNSATLGDGITIKDILPAIGNVEGLCSHAITSPYLNTKNALTIGRSNASWIYWTGILDTLGLSTVDEFKDWVIAQKNAGTPVQIVYGINTPETFQFTPQYFTTIDGINNVWSDCGNTKAIFNLTPASMALATTTENGLMSSTDKAKLDGIETGANKTVVDTALNSTSTNPVQNKAINSAISEKQNTITGAATTVTDSNLTASRALVSNSSGKIAVSAVTSTELGYLDGVTSAIQTQLNGKVPTSRTINGKALTENITLTASDIGIDSGDISETVLTEAKTYTDNKITELKGANSGLAELDTNGKVPSSQLPSYVDDVLEYANLAGFPTTGESGKIYIAQDTNKSYRWSGSAYVEISSSLALGETSSTAYRGDRGAAAYKHAVTNKGIAKSSGLYKITTNSEGHVTAATAVAKADITGLGIPAQDTTYSAAGSSLGLVKSGGDVTISDGVITVNDDSHAHTIENIDNLQTVLDGKFSLSSASNLGSGTDLNDITTPRAYYAIASDAATMSNCPVTSGFKMVVMQGYTDTRSHQLLFTANSSSIFYRMRGTSAWTEWVNLSKTTLLDLGITATATELNYVDGVTSNVQTQINNLSTLVGDTAVSEQIDEAFNDVITGLSISGKVITYTKGDGTSDTIETQDTTYSAAGSSLGLVKTGGNVTINDGIITVNSVEALTSSAGSSSLPVYFKNGKPTVITSLGLGNKTSNDTTNITLTRKVRDTVGNNYSVFKVAPLASAETIDIDFAMYIKGDTSDTVSDHNNFRISLNSIYPAADNTKNIGSSNNRWANIYATTFHGALEGNATTATNVAWSGITGKPSYYDAKTAREAEYYICNDMGESSTATSNSTLFVCKLNASASTTNGALTYKKGTDVWSWIKTKSDDIYLPLSGGTLTNTLKVPYLLIEKSNNWPSIGFNLASGINRAGFMYDGATNNRLMFKQYGADMDNASTRYGENYTLPKPTEGITADKWYSILTSKNTVTVAQGGTGATDAATARTNLGITPANIGAAPTSHTHQYLRVYSGTGEAGFGISDSGFWMRARRAGSNGSLANSEYLYMTKDGQKVYTYDESGTYVSTMYSNVNKPDLEDIDNIIVSTSTPTSVTNGKWYLVKQG